MTREVINFDTNTQFPLITTTGTNEVNNVHHGGSIDLVGGIKIPIVTTIGNTVHRALSDKNILGINILGKNKGRKQDGCS